MVECNLVVEKRRSENFIYHSLDQCLLISEIGKITGELISLGYTFKV